jgi:RNA polymerase sigma-70 factor (ECF subfamily)
VQVPTSDARFRHMYLTHRDAVWAYVMRRTGRDDVDDAVAEVFTVAWRKIDGSPDVTEQLPWLYGISKNVVRNANRSSMRRQRLWTRAAAVPPEDAPSADVQVVRNLEDTELLAAVGTLRPVDQELLRLRTWEELPIKDVAIVVGMSPKAVESRLVRIRTNLARILAVQSSPSHVVRPGLAEEGGGQ